MREKLALEYSAWLVEKYKFAADVSLHGPDQENNNWHAHVYTSKRELTPAGFTSKIQSLNSIKTGSGEIKSMREEWARRVNLALAEHGIAATIDHRSNAERGLEALPTKHEGNGSASVRIRAENDDIRAMNAIDLEMADLLKQRAQLVAAEKISEASEMARRAVERAMPELAAADLEIELPELEKLATHTNASSSKLVRAVADSIAAAQQRVDDEKAQKSAQRAATEATHAHAALKFDGGEPELAPAPVLLPASPSGRCLPELAAVLPEPSCVHAQPPH